MKLGYIKDENGKLVPKWVKEGEEKNPDVLFHVAAQFGDYTVTDEEHMVEAKEALLEQMFNTIRKLATKDEFWIVKKPSDFENEKNPLLALGHDAPQWAKEGKILIAWKIGFPSLEGYYTYDDAEKIQKQLDECCVITE